MKPLDCDNDLFQFQTHYISNSEKLVIKCYWILNAPDKEEFSGRHVYYVRKYTCYFVRPWLQPSSPTPDARSITISLIVIVPSCYCKTQIQHLTGGWRVFGLYTSIVSSCLSRTLKHARVFVDGEWVSTMNARFHAHHVYVVNFMIQRI